MIEHLPNVHKDLGSIPSAEKTEQKDEIPQIQQMFTECYKRNRT